MAEANVRSHGPSDRPAAPAARVRGALAMVAAALAGLRGWLVAGRHYQPERRYMRGGQPRAEGASAQR